MDRAVLSTSSQKPAAESPSASSALALAVALSKRRRNIPYSQWMAGRQPVKSASETAPLCACGCGEMVRPHRGTWNKYVAHHQPSGRMSMDARQRISARMTADNPMRRPDVAAKVSASQKGRPRTKSPEGLRNIAAAARKRMLSAANPMRDPLLRQQSVNAFLQRHPSKSELAFDAWTKGMNLPLVRVGDGSLWIGRRNPDFRIVGQKKVVELTQKEVFIGRRKARNWMNYGVPTIEHYRKKRWRCLVIFVKDRVAFPPQLAKTIADFASPESSWSAVWEFDGLMLL